MSPHSRGLLLTLIGVLAIVPDSLFVRLIPAPPLTIAFWRALFAGISLGVPMLVIYRGRLREELTALGWRGLLYALCVGAVGVLFVLAIAHTSVASALFIIAAMPVIAALIAWIVLGEKASPRIRATMVAVVPGLAVIASASLGAGGGHLWGDLAALSNAVIFAIGLTIVRGVQRRSIILMAPLGSLISAAVLLPVAPIWEVGPGGWGLMLAHGGIFIALATGFLVLGARDLPPPEVALLLLLESVLAPLIAWGLLGEVPGVRVLIGGAMVLGALLISNIVALSRMRRAVRA